MQAIFRRYLIAMMSLALVVILFFNFQMSSRDALRRASESARLKLQQVAQVLTSNDLELKNLTSSLGEDYLTRARAFAFIIEQNPAVLNSQEKLEEIKRLLNVDELHVIDENGILFAGTVPKYFNMDFKSTVQTSEFLPLLEKPGSFLVQPVQPNGAESKVFQYIGISRTDQKGLVQVGLEPRRLLQAQERNALPAVFLHIPVDSGTTLFAADLESGKIRASSDPALVGKAMMSDLGFDQDYAIRYLEGAFHTPPGGVQTYYQLAKFNTYILGYAQPANVLYSGRFLLMGHISIYLLFTFLVLIWVINWLLRRQIVDGIHDIMQRLSLIADGHLESTVRVDSNPEFQQLSNGINRMVASLLEATVKVSRILEQVHMPIGLFEFRGDSANVMATERLRQILMLTEREAEALYQDKDLFMRYLKGIMRQMDEEEIYKISGHPETWVKIHLYTDPNGCSGVVTDVTADMLEKRIMRHERDYDALTGLCNLSKFKQLTREILEQPQPPGSCAMLMLDLDRFKQVNDQFGHDFGDVYLRETARLLSAISKRQCLAARRSGDEFCVLLYQFASRAEIMNLISAFYTRITLEPIRFPDGSDRPLQISAGLAWYGGELTHYEGLLHAADMALYDAKENGRGVCRQYDS